MASPALSNNQIPDKSILDQFNRQAYLGNEYTIALAGATITSAVVETPILLFNNPSTSGKTAFHNLRRAAVLTSGNPCIFRFYFNPTITSNGTPITPACTRMRCQILQYVRAFLIQSLALTVFSLGSWLARHLPLTSAKLS